MRRRRWLAAAFTLLALVAIAEPTAARMWRAATLLVALSAAHTHQTANAAPTLIEEVLFVPGRHGPIRARLYRRADVPRGPGLVVAHGVHYRGIDEARLVPFARELARAGLTVLTPELRDLADYRITTRGVDTISDAALYLSERRDAVNGPKVGLLGFSFAGGLSLVAQERPELSGRLSFVASVGGHHDLSRVLGFLLENRIETPKGTLSKRAHEYGLVVLVYGQIDTLVPAADQQTLKQAFREWLHGNRERARAIASRRTTQEGERLFSLLENGRLAELGPRLKRYLNEHQAELATLSPRGRLVRATIPVYLLHGSGDDVIPAKAC